MAAPTRFGLEFLVNTITLNAQNQSNVQALANGKFVVAWTDHSGLGGDAFDGGIEAQVFNADGSKLRSQVLINAVTTGDQREPDIAPLTDGRFVVSWLDGPSSSTSGTAFGRVFNNDGSSITPQFQLPSFPSQSNGAPAIAPLIDGSIANTQSQNVGPNADIVAGRFSPAGTPVGPLSATGGPGDQIEPRVAALSDGKYVVVWQDQFGFPADNSLKGQLFTPGG